MTRPLTNTTLRCHVRWMFRADMPAVLDIESRSFDFPWSESDFLNCLRQRNCIGMVAECSGKIVGFMVYELHKTRLHVLNFAVEYDFRRSGVGRQMAQKLINKQKVNTYRNRILLEVRETNVDAQLFWKAMGFRAVNTLRYFYADTDEDAYLMQYSLCKEAP